MIRNYFKVAVRNLRRNSVFSILNIAGLALGMSVCLGVIMLVADQMSYDQYNPSRHKIFRVLTRHINADGGSGNQNATSPLPLAQELKESYTGIEQVVRFRRGFGNNWMELEHGHNVNIPLSGYFADSDALSLMAYELQYGDQATALLEPYSVVLTAHAASKLFNTENPLGEIIKVGELGEYTVTGVLRETDNKTHIAFEALASMSTVESLERAGILSEESKKWENFFDGWTYVQLPLANQKETVEDYLNEIAEGHPMESGSLQYELQNISSITPGPFVNNAIGPFMPIVFIYFLGGLALVVMLTSCFNFTNMTLARSFSRAREIGIRKANGAQRSQVFGQLIVESIVTSSVALFFAVVILQVVKPMLLGLRFAQIFRWDMEGNVWVYTAFLVFSILVGLIAGIVPASVLSRFDATRILKGPGRLKLFSALGLRKTLLVAQFNLCMIFLVTAFALRGQMNLFLYADHGFQTENCINLRLNGADATHLQNALESYGNLTGISAASHAPATGVTYGKEFKRTAASSEAVSIDYFAVDKNYLTNMGLSLIAGRFFDSTSIAGNQHMIVLNEKATKAMGFSTPEDAVGSYVFAEHDSTQYQVAGIVENYYHQILIGPSGPMALQYDPGQFNMLHIRFSGDFKTAEESLLQAWSKVNPELKPDYQLFEIQVSEIYETIFQDFVSVVSFLSVLAIVIACMGLLGMAIYLTEIRRKEVSIRKVLGAENVNLMLLLSRGFFVMMIIAIATALPVAWFINNLWLEQIAYRIALDIRIVLPAIAVIVGIGVLTVGSQTITAALRKPVDSLTQS